MNPLDKNDDNPVAQYFKNLGFEYSWDFSSADGAHWHEVYDKGKLLLQIEMVPLNEIIDSFMDREDKSDGKCFFIAGPEEDYQIVLNKVKEYENRT